MINLPAPLPDQAKVIQPRHTGVAAPPVHSLSALVTIVLDATWGIFEFSIVAIPFVSLITAFLCFFAVFSIQKFVARDGWGGSYAKAVVMAILAGVPFFVVGTAAGTVLLAWAGVSELSRLGSGKR